MTYQVVYEKNLEHFILLNDNWELLSISREGLTKQAPVILEILQAVIDTVNKDRGNQEPRIHLLKTLSRLFPGMGPVGFQEVAQGTFERSESTFYGTNFETVKLHRCVLPMGIHWVGLSNQTKTIYFWKE